MSSGKAKIAADILEGDYLLNQKSSIKVLNDPHPKVDDLTQIMLISEQFNQNFKYANLQPLDEDLYDIFHKVMEIHLSLSNNKDKLLSHNQIIDYCFLERYFMKKYLKKVIKKIT
ncbi:MAG: hypothetical protein ACTSV5_01280 [Promethearchaeota archaeon]